MGAAVTRGTWVAVLLAMLAAMVAISLAMIRLGWIASGINARLKEAFDTGLVAAERADAWAAERGAVSFYDALTMGTISAAARSITIAIVVSAFVAFVLGRLSGRTRSSRRGHD